MRIPDFTARTDGRRRRVAAQGVPVALLLALAACFPSPNAPRIPRPDLAGTYTGTFESSWGHLPISASVQGEEFSVSGRFTVGPGKAEGTLGGSIQGEDLFRGTFTITYLTADGAPCTGTLQFDGGFSSVLVSSAFVIRQDCPDSPLPVRIQWTRSR
jgi:hypothetical protein